MPARCFKDMPRLVAILAAALLAPAAQAAAAIPARHRGQLDRAATVVSAERRRPARDRRQAARDLRRACVLGALPGAARRAAARRRPPARSRSRARSAPYSGTAPTRLRCAGSRARARDDRFQITRRVRRGGRRLAANLAGSATVTGSCAGSAARLVVRWTAEPRRPARAADALFSSAPDPVSLRSTAGSRPSRTPRSTTSTAGGSSDREWDFGDPASGAANTASGAQVRRTSTRARHLHRQVDGHR